MAVTLGAVLAALCGCGGSGSSGFDVIASEASTIQHVIDTGGCTAFEDRTFCASGVTAPGPFAGALVKIAAPQGRPLVCEGLPISEKCTAPLAFTTEGFSRPTSLLAAVAEAEDGPWQLAAVTVTESVDGGARTVSIAVPARTDTTEPTPLIAAVLVYDGTPPDELPLRADRLADFDVDLVYVSQRLEIIVPR
ncbi:MAG: hypothetical protein B6D46_06105 [Polyangiaceae bacterium UTPRO1]|nr:MAG: hypothetical protein B6D46_06105 [Polyangiaceae bacterium UTPRO1]